MLVALQEVEDRGMLERHFQLDDVAVWLVVVFVAVVGLLRWRRRSAIPHLLFSDLIGLSRDRVSWSLRLSRFPKILYVFSWVFFLGAFVDPHFLIERPQVEDEDVFGDEKPREEKTEELSIPTEGIGIYLVVDVSGSMEEEVQVTVDRKQLRMSRLELLKRLTSQFVKGNRRLNLQGRRNDMIGLVSFARVAHVLVPLTLDHEAVVEHLAKLRTVRRNDQEGTALGYAVLKTANMIAATKHFAQDLVKEGQPAYDIKNTIMIVITDGFQNPHPLDQEHHLRNIGVEEAAKVAKDNDIRVYIINVERAILRQRYLPQKQQLENAATMTGGKFYVVDANTPLQSIYQDIDHLEKSILPDELRVEAIVEETAITDKSAKRFDRVSWYPYLVGLGMLSLLIAIVLDTTFLRRAP